MDELTMTLRSFSSSLSEGGSVHGRPSVAPRAATLPAPSAERDLQEALRRLQGAARAGEVEAQEARVAEGGPRRQRHAGAQAGLGRVRQLEATDVQPGQVRGLHV